MNGGMPSTFHAQIAEGLLICPISAQVEALLPVDTLLLFTVWEMCGKCVGNVWSGC